MKPILTVLAWFTAALVVTASLATLLQGRAAKPIDENYSPAKDAATDHWGWSSTSPTGMASPPPRDPKPREVIEKPVVPDVLPKDKPQVRERSQARDPQQAQDPGTRSN